MTDLQEKEPPNSGGSWAWAFALSIMTIAICLSMVACYAIERDYHP